MPLDAPPVRPSAEPKISWREIAAGLWVGRSDDQHAGIIEHGRKFTFTDADGAVHPGFDSLAAAQEAATGPIAIIPAAPTEPVEQASRRSVLLAVCTALAGAGTIALCGFALTILH